MSFDRIAPYYDVLARLIFGRTLEQAQRTFVDQIPPAASVLIVGGGTGWVLEATLVNSRPGRVLYLETSAQMLARASRRMIRRAKPGSVEFRVGDETTLSPDERFDVLMTPFVLDLFTEQTLTTHLLPRLTAALKPGGQWLVTDFMPTGVWWQRVLLWAMIRFFRLTAGIEARHLADWPRLLAEAGLVQQERQVFVRGMVSADVWTYPNAG